MIQTRTKIQIKDNSGLLAARCVRAAPVGRERAKVGSIISAVITKTAGLKAQAKKRGASNASKLKTIQKILITITRSKIRRYDGSSIVGPDNYGVVLNVKTPRANKKVIDLGFKRITSSVTFELRKAKTGLNLLKLAKGRF